jgi:hypothetical protein
MAQDGIGAVVGPLEGGTTLPRCSQAKGAWRRLVGSSSGNRRLKFSLLEREKKQEHPKVFLKFLKKYYEQKISFHAKTHLAKQLEFKKLLSWGKTSFFPRLRAEFKEYSG